MKNNQSQLKTITQVEFYEIWNAYKSKQLLDNQEVLNFFKPFVQTIPKLALGEYYWQIFNNDYPVPKILLVGGSVEKMTPFTNETLMTATVKTFFSIFHPDDLDPVLTFIAKAFQTLLNMNDIEREKYNFTVFVRIKNSEGEFIWNSLQYPALYFDKDNNFLYGMCLYTNVHHLMQNQTQPILTILDSSNKRKQIFTCITKHNFEGEQKDYPTITNREKEIITLLSQGKASKQIGAILGISKNTVDNHRQRLLKKFKVNSSAELITKALFA